MDLFPVCVTIGNEKALFREESIHEKKRVKSISATRLFCRGTQILRADKPEGPFVPLSDGPVTPADWECLDGTLYVAADGRLL